jgi:hypothetical protein
MRNMILTAAAAFTATALIAPAAFAGNPAPAPLKVPTHMAPHMPVSGPDACLGGMRFLSHAAYVPAVADHSVRCGHYLPTDTMMTIRRWDRT